jgi:hypothetical protein
VIPRNTSLAVSRGIPQKQRPLFMKKLVLTLLAFASCHAFAAELKFTNVPNFFEATPGGEPVGASHGGAVIDKAGNIYATTDTKRGILVFSPEGKFIRNFGSAKIHGLELRDEGGT